MTVKTRGSAALDKAQRRLASLKSIDEELDLGYGLTVDAYTQMIIETRQTLEVHNKLLSEVEESRKIVTRKEQTLSELSGRMLSGVATRYGKSSIQYLKAGGSNRIRGGSQPAVPEVDAVPT
jgi:hypothetical protein